MDLRLKRLRLLTHLKYNFSFKEEFNTFYRAQTSNWRTLFNVKTT